MVKFSLISTEQNLLQQHKILQFPSSLIFKDLLILFSDLALVLRLWPAWNFFFACPCDVNMPWYIQATKLPSITQYNNTFGPAYPCTLTKHHFSYTSQESVEASKYILVSFYLLQEIKTSKDSAQNSYILVNYFKCICLHSVLCWAMFSRSIQCYFQKPYQSHSLLVAPEPPASEWGISASDTAMQPRIKC